MRTQPAGTRGFFFLLFELLFFPSGHARAALQAYSRGAEKTEKKAEVLRVCGIERAESKNGLRDFNKKGHCLLQK